jgi:hypothetical protein
VPPLAVPPLAPPSADCRRLPGVIRDALEALCLQNDRDIPADLPMGPWPTLKAGTNALQAWALMKGFKFILESKPKEPTSRAGSKCYLSCKYVRAASSTAKQRRTVSMGDVGEKCHAYIRLEDSTKGWVPMSFDLAHSAHPLEAPPANAAAAEIQAGAHGKIPQALFELGTELRAAGFTAALIDQAIKSKARGQDLQLTWTIDDVYNTFCRDGHEDTVFDANKFVQSLKERHEAEGLPYEVIITIITITTTILKILKILINTNK